MSKKTRTTRTTTCIRFRMTKKTERSFKFQHTDMENEWSSKFDDIYTIDGFLTNLLTMEVIKISFHKQLSQEYMYHDADSDPMPDSWKYQTGKDSADTYRFTGIIRFYA